jgi:hypothetical protein
MTPAEQRAGRDRELAAFHERYRSEERAPGIEADSGNDCFAGVPETAIKLSFMTSGR